MLDLQSGYERQTWDGILTQSLLAFLTKLVEM